MGGADAPLNGEELDIVCELDEKKGLRGMKKRVNRIEEKG